MSDKSALNLIDWVQAASHFKTRVSVSKRLLRLHEDKNFAAFADLAIGITDDDGNYSAADHPKLKFYISENLNWKGRVYDLGREAQRTL